MCRHRHENNKPTDNMKNSDTLESTESRTAAGVGTGDLVSPSEEQRAPDWEALKLALNNAIWMHAPASTTLGQADQAACLAIGHLGKCYNDVTARVGMPG